MQKECDYCKVILCDNRCASCLEANYCSRECQLAGWPSHKAYCQISGKLTAVIHETIQRMLGDIHIVYANAGSRPTTLNVKIYMTAREFIQTKGAGELVMITAQTPDPVNIAQNDAKHVNFKFIFKFTDMAKTTTIMSPPDAEGIAKRHPGATFMAVRL